MATIRERRTGGGEKRYFVEIRERGVPAYLIRSTTAEALDDRVDLRPRGGTGAPPRKGAATLGYRLRLDVCAPRD